MNYKEEMHNRVYTVFHQKYGRKNHHLERLDAEMACFDKYDAHEPFLLMQLLTAKCRANKIKHETSLDGYLVAEVLGMTRFSSGRYQDKLPYTPRHDHPISFWIRVGEDSRDMLRDTLVRYVSGDVMESVTLRGTSYALHPGRNGGTEFRIYGSSVYTIMDKVRTSTDEVGDVFAPDLWENGFYQGYIPGFFSEAEEYELRHSRAKDLFELAELLQQMRGLPIERAVYLASDYIEASLLVQKAPAEWFAAYFNQEYYHRAFDWQTMGQGFEICRRAGRLNRQRLFFTQAATAGEAQRKNDLYRTCEEAYRRGICFLPPDPLHSHRTRFLSTERGDLLCPLGRSCALTSESCQKL